MSATWAVNLVLVGYVSECAGNVCSVLRKSSSNYRSIYYRENMYCSNKCCGAISKRYCCDISENAILGLKITGGTLAIILLLILLWYLIYCSCKTRTRPRRRVTQPPPRRTIVASTPASRGIEPGYGEKSITHYPVPPFILANDPPPPYGSSDQAHLTGQNSDGGQINTQRLPPRTIHPPPSMPTPAYQAPPQGTPPQSDNPPMPQSDHHSTSPSNETLATQPPHVVTASEALGSRPTPALTPLPPSDQAPTTAAPTQGGDVEGETY
ncbi:uncharacterized protein [Haliotis asinina]|uniref:uncharacterized protein n=1 Tax=Haliotis asinina TaxID=109174 RepID=UPI00353270ED